jgi:uncharacterized protein (DUF885 family)
LIAERPSATIMASPFPATPSRGSPVIHALAIAPLLFALMPADDPAVGPLAPLMETARSPLETAVERWAADRQAVARRFPVEASPNRRDRLRKFAEAWRKRLEEVDFDGLNTEGKVDYLLLDNALKRDLARLDRDDKKAAATAPVLPFAEGLIRLVEAKQKLEPVDPEGAAIALAEAKTRLAEARKGAESKLSGDGAKQTAVHAAEAVDDLRRALGDWFRFYDGYDPMFSWWVRSAYRPVESGLAEYATYLRETLGGRKGGDETIYGDPVGRQGLLDDLRAEMIDYSPEQLLAVAEVEFAWCEAEMKKASREMGFGDDWKKALDKVKTLHRKVGEQPELVRELAKEAVDFVEKNDLVTIPALAKEDWPIDMMSPQAQKVNPFFLGGDRIIVSYPTDSMELSDKLMSVRANNVHFSRATVHHELIPGHHLQYFMNSRFSQHRRPFSTPFWIEGWALYWEMLLWDKGFPKTPEDRVGMLFWRMHRCARIVFSLKFHMGKMTPEEAVQFLVDKVGHERFSASGEVRRSFNGSYPPLYQAAYMLGGLQLRALHKELVESGKMTDRQFHDRILKGGTMPIEMVRVLLTNPDVKRDFQPRWHFAGDVNVDEAPKTDKKP